MQGYDGYLYYCTLCDEALVLSAREIHPKKICLLFDQTCPGCGFELDRLLGCDAFKAPAGAVVYANPKCSDPDSFFAEDNPFRPSLTRSSSLNRDLEPDLTTGIRQVDRALVLKLGQLAVLQGKAAHNISLLLCARTISPSGINSDAVFIDGGNRFDTYTITQYGMALGMDSEKVRERIHLSRAFTHHQLALLVREKLPLIMKEHAAKLAVVSDITLLYCDPDVREKGEALDIFRKSVRFLGSLAEQNKALVLITNLESRNPRMEDALVHSAHVYARLEDRGSSTQLTVQRHPFTVQREPVRFDRQALSTSLDEHFR